MPAVWADLPGLIGASVSSCSNTAAEDWADVEGLGHGGVQFLSLWIAVEVGDGFVQGNQRFDKHVWNWHVLLTSTHQQTVQLVELG
ncbi:hypothetical protein WICPIJ_003853 [Wickerhamomyces pijperi]|uniref:Uncharacterized protein n=1 Tax=Wickerhamomyces pijperi TaxID=599730 RepID=A0A9P8Q747_WICPI|nr:hypothetical protein WICPIJ_003853 [Wickerhamomyces pijperi]